MQILYLILILGVFLVFKSRKGKVAYKVKEIETFETETFETENTNTILETKKDKPIKTFEEEKKYKEYTAKTNYTRKENFWGSDIEKHIYKQMLDIGQEHLTILPHVSLGEIFKPTPCDEQNKKGREKYINLFHVDFLICEKESLTPLIGIEFDGKYHKHKEQQLRDAFKNELFRVQEIPLLRFDYEEYKQGIIIEKIKEMLCNVKVYCASCGSEMIFITGKDGKDSFFGCKNYYSNGCRYKRRADFKYAS